VPKCELEDLWKSQEQVKVPANIKDLITDLREKMHDAGVRSSNRRWIDSIGVLKASAALEGRDSVENQDLEVLSSTLWHQPEEKVTVRQVILSMTDPGLAKVLELLDGAREELEKLRREGQQLTTSEMLQRASQAATEIAAIIEEAEKTAPELQRMLTDLEPGECVTMVLREENKTASLYRIRVALLH